MTNIKYSVSYPYDNLIFVEMFFFDGNAALHVKDPLVKPIYDILLRYDLKGDLGFKMAITAGSNLNDTNSVDNLMQCFKELEQDGYVDATELEKEIKSHFFNLESFSSPKCRL